MDNLIQQLKDNEKPFGLMSEEMREWMVTVEKPEDIEQMVCRVNLKIDWFSMCIKINKGNCNHMEGTFRLRPDYEDEPEIVECEITLNPETQIWGYKCPCSGDPVNADLAHSCPGFRLVGLKFEDGLVGPTSMYYSDSAGQAYCKAGDGIDEVTILHATHVLFRKKQE